MRQQKTENLLVEAWKESLIKRLTETFPDSCQFFFDEEMIDGEYKPFVVGEAFTFNDRVVIRIDLEEAVDFYSEDGEPDYYRVLNACRNEVDTNLNVLSFKSSRKEHQEEKTCPLWKDTLGELFWVSNQKYEEYPFLKPVILN